MTLSIASSYSHASAPCEVRVPLLQAFLALEMVTVLSVSVMQVERETYQSNLQSAYRDMEKLATIDPLTSVGNRRLLEDRLEAEWARAQRKGQSVAMLIVDVDRFKTYNDHFGHLGGDDCLRATSQALRTLKQRSTHLLARYGGEEFILLLPETSLEGAAAIAEEVRQLVETLHLLPGSPLRRAVTVSVGCAAVVPDSGSSPNLLIGAADEALYRAKQNGRNRVEIAEEADVRLQPNLFS